MKTNRSLGLLAKRSYASYLARLTAEKRIRSLKNWWNGAQYSLSTALVLISIIFIAFPNAQSKTVVVFLVLLSVLALVVSLVVSFLDYSARASAMFRDYRLLQAFSVKVESLVDTKARVSRQDLSRFQKEYDSIMDASENHRSIDHKIASSNNSGDGLPLKLVLISARPKALPVVLIVIAVAITLISAWSII